MTAVLFAPHNDDETLFAFYLMLRHKAEVVVVLRSMKEQLQQNGPTFQTRELETLCACTVAGVRYVQWDAFTDIEPDWGAVEPFIVDYLIDSDADVVIAPAWEDGGHEDHNAVASIVRQLALTGDFELLEYLTYRRGHGRSEGELEIIPTRKEMWLKAAALRCYESQAKHPPTAYWFGTDQREFVLC